MPVNAINRIDGKGRVDRSKLLSFTFNGTSYQGYRGDTLASALLAHDVHLIGRSFKYHRPRGVFTAGSEEPSGLIQLEDGAGSEPNARATMIELYDGLVARSQNCWPSVRHDIGAINNLLSGLLAAGFYYKTFMWPASWWNRVYERIIRHSAGLGRVPTAPDTARYAQRYAHCDVLVVGAGPAGLAAALAAARSGARVILADEQAELGGRLLSDMEHIGERPAVSWVESVTGELAALESVTLLPRTAVVGYYEQNFLTAVQRVASHLGPKATRPALRERFWKIRARQVVLATGAIERPPVFADNDRPGTMLASAVRTYINRFGVLPGRQTVVFTNNNDAYRTALDIDSAGGKVEIVDVRPDPKGTWVDKATALGIKIHKGWGIVATSGRTRLRGCEVGRLSEDGARLVGPSQSIACDTIACSAGWNPTVHLWCQARGRLEWDPERACFRPNVSQQAVRAAGAANGSSSLEDCLLEGFQAGARAASDGGFAAPRPPAPNVERIDEGTLYPVYCLPDRTRAGQARGRKHFHDLGTDATVADIHLAVREGYLSVEHLKRYTTTGMGPDQGKTSNVNALAIMAGIRDLPVQQVGTTTFRPPFVPVTLGAVVGQTRGELYHPRRKTPLHSWHETHGAILEYAGEWIAPRAYLRDAEDGAAAIQRECKTAATHAGLFDASTLGKIDVRGPDALDFLNRVYTNNWSDLAVGQCRYGLMLNEQGMIFDAGTLTRIGADHFHITTTAANGTRVMNWLERWLQCEWPNLRVYLTEVSEQWAVAVLWGPLTNTLLGLLHLDGMTSVPGNYSECMLAGVPARIFPTRFSGERSYEINVPARHGPHLWRTLLYLGASFDLCPIGTEALQVLRTERGFMLMTPEADGSVTPADLGLEALIGQDKGDFLGRRSLSGEDLRRPDRKQLVGIIPSTPERIFSQGAHLADESNPRPPIRAIGHIVRSCMSPALGHSITLALVKAGRSRIGEMLTMHTLDGRTEQVRVAAPVFVETNGARING
jgi:sarcosine oxidase, subunit alpha